MKKYFAEALGTFGIVFCGTGAIIINQEYQNVITHLGIAITFGLIVCAMIYSFANVSGAHFNPAVSLSMVIFKKFPLNTSIIYIIFQFAGGIAASVLLKLMFPLNELLGTTLPNGEAWVSFVLEIILTFFLMFAVFQIGESNSIVQSLGGLILGCIVLMEALFAGPVSGASMNPARSLAPALISGHTEFLWIYLLACPLGAVFAGFIFKITRAKQT